MKKTSVLVLLFVILLGLEAHAQNKPLVEMRNKIFEESKQIKSLLTDPKDTVLVNSMWDSCIMAISQLDAYFSMVGIFNSIKKEDVTEASINYLTEWLNGIKKTNELNIKGLSAVSGANEPNTKIRMDILKRYFVELNKKIDDELVKHSILINALKMKKKK